MEETGNFVAKLNEYAHSAHVLVNYEDVCSDGPDHIKTFTVRAVVNGKPYPDGVGKTKKEARQCAARHALLGLEMEQREPENTKPCPPPPLRQTESSTGESRPLRCQAGINQANYTCWLNEYSQKERVHVRPVESTRMGPNNATQCCYFVIGDKEYPAGFGKNKKDAKEEAAKLVYHAIYGNQTSETVDENCNDTWTQRREEQLNQSVSALREKMGNMNMSGSSPVPKQNILAEINYITILNHYCQKTKRFHDFILVERRGPAHNPEFVYKVILDKKEYPEGVGKNAMEAKQQAAKMAWSAFQEQSDWDSQISCKSTLSEEGASSSPSMPSSSRGSLDSSSSSFVMITASDSTLSDGSSPKNSDVKPKIRLAANFQMAPTWSKGDDSDFSRETKVAISATQRTSSQPAVSRFESEYDSIERLGKGGFGQVYKARRQLEGKFFAVKKVRSNKKALREVGALADLQHPHIVRYYTSWIDDFDYQCDTSDSISLSGSDTTAGKFLYIQMELCNKTLEVWMDERNTLRRDPRRREESLVIALQIVTGVEYIHSRRLIHRDLKPVNIMFGSDGGVKIGDFGLVTADDSDNDQNRTERTRKTGTTSYMAPEQMSQSNYDRKVDIFALGLTYFELLWKRSTKSEKAAIWSDVRSQTFPEQFSLKFPPEARTIQWMLSEKPEERPDAKTLRTELEAFFSPSLHREQNLHHGNNTV